MFYLLLILLIVAASLVVVLWGGTYFFQGYIYTEPSPGIFWQAPAAAILLTVGYTIWCLSIAFNSSATPQNLPIDTLFRFSPQEDMTELGGKPAPKIWAVKLDRKKTGPDKDGDKVAYVARLNERGQYFYQEPNLRKLPWNGQDVIAVEMEKPDGTKMRLDLLPTEESDYRRFMSVDGWVIREFENGPTGIPIKFRWGKWFVNLLFNLLHFVGWFIALWLVLRFQWSHALGFAIVMWVAATLLILPMMLGYAGKVAAERQGPKTAAIVSPAFFV